MLNRRILRIKAFKVIFSYAENPSMTLGEAEAELEASCQATRDLYLYMLSIIGPLTREASERINAAKGKFNPTEEERNPNMRFVNNRIAPLLESDPDLKKLLSRKKLSWDQNDAFIRKLYETLRTRDYFIEYMNSESEGLKEDAALMIKIFENEFVDNEELEPILEDMSILWVDDLAYALSYCCRTLKSLAAGRRWELPPLYQSDILKLESADPKSVQSDSVFVRKLLTSAFNGFERYYDLVAQSVPKWDKDRLFTVDIALVVCGLAEAEAFPETPAKIPVSEYVEISKYYSTPRSSSFVNATLDNIIRNKLSIKL